MGPLSQPCRSGANLLLSYVMKMGTKESFSEPPTAGDQREICNYTPNDCLVIVSFWKTDFKTEYHAFSFSLISAKALSTSVNVFSKSFIVAIIFDAPFCSSSVRVAESNLAFSVDSSRRITF